MADKGGWKGDPYGKGKKGPPGKGWGGDYGGGDWGGTGGPPAQTWQQHGAEQKENRKLEKMVLQDQNKDVDNKGCGNIAAFWGLVNALMLVIPLAGDHWWSKTFSASGVQRLYISTGLFNMEITVDCAESSVDPEQKLCNVYKEWANHESEVAVMGWSGGKVKGVWALSEMKETLCGETEETKDKQDYQGCYVLKALAADGYVPVYGLPATAAIESSSILTFLIWFWLIPPIQQLPISFAALGGISDDISSGAYGLRGGGGAPFTWCTMCLMCAMCMCGGRLMTIVAMPKHSEEVEHLSEDELWAIQDAKAEAQWYGHYG